MNVYWHNGPFFSGQGNNLEKCDQPGIIPLVEFFFYKFYTRLVARVRPVWYAVIRICEGVMEE